MIISVQTYQEEYGEDLPDLIVTTADDDTRITYWQSSGVLHPGRVWKSVTANGQYRVTLFIPFPDGPPQVLNVEGPAPA
jgi:hypothetical protein